jgi:PAS domain S-box-containing protein
MSFGEDEGLRGMASSNRVNGASPSRGEEQNQPMPRALPSIESETLTATAALTSVDFRNVLDGLREELIGRSFWEAYPGTEHTPLGELYRRAMRERVALATEHHFVWPDGRATWFDIRVNPVNSDRLAILYRDVTERHRAEHKLRASEQRFRGAVEAFTDALWTNDPEGRMRGEQPGWAGLTGQSYEDYQDFGWADAVHPNDAQPTIEAWQAAVATRSTFAFEHRVRRHDGVWRRFSVRAVPVLGEDGSIAEWVGVHSDITDLRENELRFRQLADTLDAVFYFHDIDAGRISFVSSAYERIWRKPAEELYRDISVCLDPVPVEDRAIIRHALARQLAGESTDIRYRMVVDGQTRYLHDRAHVMKSIDGDTRRVVGIVDDVTASTEARLQLARNAETFEALVQNNPFGVYVVDERMRFVQLSLGARRVFTGIEPLVGRDFAEIVRSLWTEPFASDVINRFRQTLETGETYVSGPTIEQRRDIDEQQAYDWRIDRVTLPDGSFGVVCYFYDLSERIALEDRLKQALADKDMLLREIDHRVRNSLTMVAALLSMQGRSADSNDVKQALSVAAARMQAVARIHERLYKGGQLGIVEFDAYLEEICRDLRTSLHHGTIKFVIDTAPASLPVDLAVPLGLVANELVTNAFKHCGDDAATISVQLTCDTDGLRLSVADTGIGMNGDYDPSSPRGLGMQVIDLLTRQIGATLTLPRAGQPAAFSVHIPNAAITG